MLFLDLPLDIVTLIVSELVNEGDTTSLYRLSKTCHALYSLAAPLIPRHVSFKVPSDRYKKFLSWLDRDSMNPSRVQTFTIQKNSRSPSPRNLTSLVQLHAFRSYASVTAQEFWNAFTSHTPSALDEITGVTVSSLELIDLLHLPRLKILMCYPKVSQSHPRPAPVRKNRSYSLPTSLESLEIREWLDEPCYSPDDFAPILTCTKSLKSLRCNVPTEKQNNSRYPMALSYLTRALRSTASTLTKLELFTGICQSFLYDWSIWGSNTLDLHEFPALRFLSASAILLLGSSELGLPRELLCSRLPRSLEELCVS